MLIDQEKRYLQEYLLDLPAVIEKIPPLMKEHPEKELLVLCGHSHTGADTTIAPGIRVLTGDSTLGAPVIQGIIHIA